MNVAVIHQHQLILDSFIKLIEIEGWRVIAGFIQFQDAIEQLKAPEIDIVILSLQGSGDTATEQIAQLKKVLPGRPILVISPFCSQAYVNSAIQAGASGYLSKNISADILIEAISELLNGELYINLSGSRVSEQSLGCRPLILECLTGREFEIFLSFAKGLNPKQVAIELNIMPKTAHVHRANIMKKLQVRSQFALLKIAMDCGLISSHDIAV